MIAKPKDWDTAQAYTGERQGVTPGGHIVRIQSVREEKSRNNKPMLVVYFDIEEGGELDGFYKRRYEAAKKQNSDAKWPGVIRYMLYAKDGVNTNSFFKGFTKAVEESNAGYYWNFDERSMTGKLVGMVFGEEEYRKMDGSIGTAVKAQQARSVQAIRDGVAIPEKKLLKEENSGYAPFDPNAGFTAVEDKLPWE